MPVGSACGVPLSGEVAGGMHVSAWMITVSFPVLNLLNESEYHTGRGLCADMYGSMLCEG